MIKEYYYLTKPGIIYGNAITTIAGFLLASRGRFDFGLFLATLLGISFVIASACVFNNLFDRDIDQRMQRTRNRAMVTGTISKTKAFIFGFILGLLGVLVLLLFTTHYALLTGLLGWVVYIALYTPLKRKTVHATLIGAISGATPPVVGYMAVTDQFDLAALLLFFILVAWQMPHFYSIGIYRLKDYSLASIPILPMVKGIKTTKIYIMIYIIIYIIISALLTAFGYTGYVYLVVNTLVGLTWLLFGLQGFGQSDDQLWARKMFRFSLIVLLIFSTLLSINSILT